MLLILFPRENFAFFFFYQKQHIIKKRKLSLASISGTLSKTKAIYKILNFRSVKLGFNKICIL